MTKHVIILYFMFKRVLIGSKSLTQSRNKNMCLLVSLLVIVSMIRIRSAPCLGEHTS